MSTSPRIPLRPKGSENAQDATQQEVPNHQSLVSDVLEETRQFLGEPACVEQFSGPIRSVAQAVTEAPPEVKTVTIEPVELEPMETPPQQVEEQPFEVQPEVVEEEPIAVETMLNEEPLAVAFREEATFSWRAFPRNLTPRWQLILNVAAITLAIWVPIAWAIAIF